MSKIIESKARNLEDVLDQIGAVAYEQLRKGGYTPEEEAFYIGHINVVLAILDAKNKEIEISLDYDDVKASFIKRASKAQHKPKEILKNQISIEDLFPGILDLIDKRIAQAKKKPKQDKE